jgi:hypothetical protein
VKTFSTLMLIICIISFTLAIADIIQRMQFTALDYSIIGMVSLIIGAGSHTSAKETRNLKEINKSNSYTNNREMGGLK